MEFAFDVRGVLPKDITRILSSQLPRLGNGLNPDEGARQLAAIVNKMGAASAKAQGLRLAVTAYQKLIASSHTLYLLRDTGNQPSVIGLLKVGRKKLFLSDPQGVQREAEPLCVLDFYVHESRQRAGHGRRLFQTMLNMEGVRVAELAIDRPSTKFLSFLKKHYKLHSDVKQGNNFVVFSQFFQNMNMKHTTSSQPINIHPRSPTTTTSFEQDSSQPTLGQKQPNLTHPPSQPTPAQTPGRLTHAKPHDAETCQKRTPNAHPKEDNSKRVFTTPIHLRTFNLSSPTCNFNWSPDVVLLHKQPIKNTPCDIITGAPLLKNHWKLPQAQCRKEDGEKAPFLTMRDKGRHLKGGSRLGFGLSPLPATVEGYHLVGTDSGMGRADSVYSHHSHNPIRPSSHTVMLPGQKFNLEPRPDRWKH